MELEAHREEEESIDVVPDLSTLSTSEAYGRAIEGVVVKEEASSAGQKTKVVTVVPFVVLTLVQFFYSGHQVLAKVALGSGVDPLLFTIYRNVVAFLVLSPAAFFLERDVRPKMTWPTFGSLNLLAFLGILGNQVLFLLGLKLTSSLVTSLVPNMVPVVTFVLAVVFGVEKVSLRKRSDHVRMLGTVICISGAVTMSVYKGMAVYTRMIDHEKIHGFVTMPARDLHLKISQWYVGVLCLLVNCISWSLYLINQGSVLQKYPLLSMATIMELIGSIYVAIVGVAYEGSKCLDLRLLTKGHLITILYGGFITSGSNLLLQSWCIQQMGPFLVSLFNPVQTLIVAFLVILLLGHTLYLGVLIGGTLIIGGFYTVLYGNRMERRSRDAIALTCSTDTKQSDLEEPLLS